MTRFSKRVPRSLTMAASTAGTSPGADGLRDVA